jgi:SAM-dependent methyltransferase
MKKGILIFLAFTLFFQTGKTQDNQNSKTNIQTMIKDTLKIEKRKGIYYLLDSNNKKTKFNAWLGSLFCFKYDDIMRKKTFPKKFTASIDKHYEILTNVLKDIKTNKTALEIACGTGDAVLFLNKNTKYLGLDISKGLLKIANKKFKENEFQQADLILADACDMPFKENSFDIAICNLSIQWFPSADMFIAELRRVLEQGGFFYCSVPVPERTSPGAKMKLNLKTADEWQEKFEKGNFDFETLPYTNGSILYFKAILKK